jgi:hypothetical protein
MKKGGAKSAEKKVLENLSGGFFRRIAAVEDSQCESFDPLDG